ncbi:helix-turn-helix domain-containing protein [Dactylosporangium sp. CA-233914]|uniref:helix-turn-helix transcriptional regulator n=1 Tax=Dactylosporangium sp. CA-233914 TaxID=3239934 RepID=UPI003D8B8EF6
MRSPVSPPVVRLATSHADEFRDWIAARYTDHERRVRPRARGFAFLGVHGAIGGLTYIRTQYTAVAVDIDCPPNPFVCVADLSAGRALVRWDGGEGRAAGSDILLLPPYGTRMVFDCNDAGTVGVTLDGVLRVAEETAGLDRAHVRFTGLRPVSAAAGRQWRDTAQYVRRGVYTRGLDHPLLLAAAERLAAASMLATFPNTTMTLELRVPRDAATPAVVRRAMAYIDANAARPITLSDVAAAVGVVPRTLQYAFRRHRDTTPAAYLRRVRLARAHEELLAAQPGDGTTVVAVAARWGFARAHRFAAAYRQAYARPPGQTLRA